MHYQAYGVLLLRMANEGSASQEDAVRMLRKALALNASLRRLIISWEILPFHEGKWISPYSIWWQPSVMAIKAAKFISLSRIPCGRQITRG